MENNNNNTVNLLTFDINTGSIGIDQQIFSLLSQIIISDRQESAERRREYERRETARNNMEIEKIKFQLEKERFFFDMEKAERLSRKKEGFNNK